ncbi:MAG: hypothetical protein IT385_02405 [Deltaproteobacteria bacterium]|nr:hypothetical protein [Deltaproteobacteria bacterium]
MRPVALALTLTLLNTFTACSDGSKKRPIGSTCTDSEQCSSGLCAESKCIDPGGDEDDDTLTNTIEVGLGTNPFEADSDGDGVADRDELDDAFAHKDTDGDGTPDALESALTDADEDCVVDQSDPHDDDPGEGATHPDVADVCPDATGVCAADGAILAVRCPDGPSAEPVCHFGDVPGWAATDDDCDGVDENCDGTPDEGGTCTTHPAWCDEIQPRVDGTYTVDPDGAGTAVAPFEVTCLFSVERGDWARLTPAVAAAAATLVPDMPREYLLRKGSRWYRSPINLVPWRWNDGAPVAGLWYYQGVDGLGGFDCLHTEALPSVGVGCMSGDSNPALEVKDGVEATGTVTVCPEAPDVFDGCEQDVEVWVRFNECDPDHGQLLADGGFGDLEDDTRRCWFTMGEGEPGRYFSFESDFPPDGFAPSLRADNPSLETEIYEVEVGQTGLPIIAGRGYIWSFWAKAAELRTIRPFLQSRDLTVPIHNADLTLGTTWALHTMWFISPGSTFDGMLSFQLGEVSTAAVWLDGVSLVDVGPRPCAPAEGEVLADGDFALPANFCWEVWGNAPVVTTATHDQDEVPPGGEAPSLRVTFSTGTEVPADSGIIQRSLVIPPNREMRLVFWLKGSAPTSVGYGLGNGEGYPGGFVTDVTTTWKQYTFDFSSGTGTSEGSLQFQFGRPEVLTVWIDGIDLIDLGPTPVR